MDAGPLDWLVDLMHDAGACRREITMSGALYSGLGWPEIVAWIEGSQQQDIPPRFRRDVMILSERYASQVNAAQELACEAPFDPGKVE